MSRRRTTTPYAQLYISSRDTKAFAACVIIVLGIFAGYLYLAGIMFEYVLWSILGKNVPFLLDIVAGAFSAPVVVWFAIACMVARSCGYEIPFLH